MKKAKFGLFVLAIAISLPITGALSELFLMRFYPDLFVMEYKSEREIVPTFLFQQVRGLPFKISNNRFLIHKDKETGFTRYQITTPQGPLYSIRVDFDSNPGKVQIKKLSFRTWDISKEQLKQSNFQNVGGIRFMEKYLVSFHSSHKDPHIIFPRFLCEQNSNSWYVFPGIFVCTLGVIYSLLLLLCKLLSPRKKASPEV